MNLQLRPRIKLGPAGRCEIRDFYKINIGQQDVALKLTTVSNFRGLGRTGTSWNTTHVFAHLKKNERHLYYLHSPPPVQPVLGERCHMRHFYEFSADSKMKLSRWQFVHPFEACDAWGSCKVQFAILRISPNIFREFHESTATAIRTAILAWWRGVKCSSPTNSVQTARWSSKVT